MTWVAFVFGVVGLIAAGMIWQRTMLLRRAEFIRSYQWPPGLLDKMTRTYPQFARKETSLVSKGLRQFFNAYLRGGRRNVSMPSEAADVLWHEFILYTKEYQAFCDKAFGQFLHHTPAVMLRPEHKNSNEGLRRVWWQCCKEEAIDPSNPSRLPLLFALDTKLNIPNGYRYVADCRGLRRDSGSSGAANCGSDFASASVDGSTDGFGDGGGGGGGGDGGGDGGGGGCGGGGD
ncbi:MAG: glycine-rich domain-containing protein [Beijerinckiaceae bacterium]